MVAIFDDTSSEQVKNTDAISNSVATLQTFLVAVDGNALQLTIFVVV